MEDPEFSFKRVLYRTGYSIPCDSRGFLCGDDVKDGQFPRVFWEDRIYGLDGGVVVAEGGMGKSTLANSMLRHIGKENCRIVDLSNPLIRRCVQKYTKDFLAGTRSNPERPTVIFDGVEGELDVFAEISELIIANRRTCKFWTMARDPMWAAMLSNACGYQGTYTLSPLSFSDVEAYVQRVLGVERSATFFKKAKRTRALCICSNPLGLKIVVGQFGNSSKYLGGFESVADYLRALCGGGNAHPLGRTDAGYPTKRVYECAQYIACALHLSGRTGIRCDGPDEGGVDGVMSIEGIASPRYPRDLCLRSLQCGLFAVVETGQFKFAHESFKDVLCAEFAAEKLDKNAIRKILFDDLGRIYPQRICLAQLLSFRLPWVFDEVVSAQPEALLPSADLCSEAQKLRICKGMIKNAGRLQRAPAFRRVSGCLSRLKCAKCDTYLRERVRSVKGDEASLLMALSIADACEATITGKSLVKIVRDDDLPIRNRLMATRILKSVGGFPADAVKLLKMFAETEDASDEKISLLVSVFDIFWPNWISLGLALHLLEVCKSESLFGAIVSKINQVVEEAAPEFLDRLAACRDFSACIKWCLNTFSNRKTCSRKQSLLAKSITAAYGRIKPRLDEEHLAEVEDVEAWMGENFVEGPRLAKGRAARLTRLLRERASKLAELFSRKRVYRTVFPEIATLLNDKPDEMAHPPLNLKRSKVWQLLPAELQERIAVVAKRYFLSQHPNEGRWEGRDAIVIRRAVVLAYSPSFEGMARECPGLLRAFALSLVRPIRSDHAPVLYQILGEYAKRHEDSWMVDLSAVWDEQLKEGEPTVYKQWSRMLNPSRAARMMAAVRNGGPELTGKASDILDCVINSDCSMAAYPYLAELFRDGTRIRNPRMMQWFLAYVLMKPELGISSLVSYCKDDPAAFRRYLTNASRADAFFNALPKVSTGELVELFYAISMLSKYEGGASAFVLKFVADLQNAIFRVLSVREEAGVADIVKNLPRESGNAKTDREQLAFLAEESELRAKMPRLSIFTLKALLDSEGEGKMKKLSWFNMSNPVVYFVVAFLLLVLGAAIKKFYGEGRSGAVPTTVNTRETYGVRNDGATIGNQMNYHIENHIHTGK